MTFALGGDIARPKCGMGILIPTGSEDEQRFLCDVCEEVFVVGDDG